MWTTIKENGQDLAGCELNIKTHVPVRFEKIAHVAARNAFPWCQLQLLLKKCRTLMPCHPMKFVMDLRG
jgi:hypothetical protein